ncbi:MAG: CDP-alcohol phosphatidyltransferase family protein [Verrucomicrobiota bacterium]|nr:CDP-alcohol phosphatidyltransferase family protein [Verrucomicrobiota bacterium]
MLMLSNGLSLIRAPIALLFLQSNPLLRLFAIIIATVTDCFDGYIARRFRATSKFGAILDPLMDKFFVYFALAIFFQEGALPLSALLAMLCRDFALCLYALVMLFSGRIRTIVFRSVRWGKATTALQFAILSALAFNVPFPPFALYAFLLMALLALFELFSPYARST